MACKRPVYQLKKQPRAPAPIRYVDPFSIASFYQERIKVYPLCKNSVFLEKRVNTSLFRTLFLRGDIPCQRSFRKPQDNNGTFLLWKIDEKNLKDLDYCYYLPIFFDGLCDSDFPYHTIACYAIQDLLKADGAKVLPVIPKLIIPIKNALSTKNRGVVAATLRIIQQLCMCAPCVGRALVPYFQNVLPVLNIFYSENVNKSDSIDYNRVGRISDIVDETLKMLERCGGSNAYIKIKHAIPTYESCVNKGVRAMSVNSLKKC